MATSVTDILEELQPDAFTSSSDQTPASVAIPGLSPEEQKILSVLTHEPMHVDKIIKATALDTSRVSSLLSVLEIKGLAKNLGAMHYVRVAS
jgi:DNA processing protein